MLSAHHEATASSLDREGNFPMRSRDLVKVNAICVRTAESHLNDWWRFVHPDWRSRVAFDWWRRWYVMLLLILCLSSR